MPNPNPRPLILLLVVTLIIGAIFILLRKTLTAQAQRSKIEAQSTQRPAKLPFAALAPFQYPPNNQPSVIFFFHPDCEHCSYEARAIKKELAAFGEAQLIWVSTADTTSVGQFAQDQKLAGLPNVHWMSDTARVFDEVFGPSSVPSVWIYNPKGQLTKHYKGETKPAALLKYLNHDPTENRH
jgi:hypothetical protein